jgi:hypothetical protein
MTFVPGKPVFLKDFGRSARKKFVFLIRKARKFLGIPGTMQR